MSKLKLSSISITTNDGTTVVLTIAEARDLHDQLAELFGPKILNTPIVIERDRWPPLWNPYQPTWISNQTGDFLPRMPSVTCSAPSGLRTEFRGDAIS